MPSIGAPPSLRLSQRQVIAYLVPETCDALRVYAAGRALTLKEVLALAVNAETTSMGVGPVLTPLRQRQFLRTRNAAKPRGESCDTRVRRGRKGLAGWFDRKEVERLRDISLESGRTVQEIAVAGAVLLLSGEDSEAPPRMRGTG